MKETLSNFVASVLPEGADPCSLICSLVLIAFGVIVTSVIIRAIFKQECGYNHGVASAMALMFAYIALMWLHDGAFAEQIDAALKCLPLIEYDGETVTVFNFAKNDLFAGCKQFIFVYFLSLIQIVLDDCVQDAKGGIIWLIVQMIITLATVVIYCFAMHCFNLLSPVELNPLAFFALTIVIIFIVALVVLQLLQSFLFRAVNPMLTEVSNFMITHRLGKTLGKALVCAIYLCLTTVLLIKNDITAFVLADMTLMVCLLPLVVLAVLWFLVGNVLFNSPQ